MTGELLQEVYDRITEECFALFDEGKKMTVDEVIIDLMSLDGVVMHSPYHHYIMPAALLVCAAMLFRGFDDTFYVPHSRNTTVYREDIEAVPELKIISSSDEAGVFCVKSENDRQIFVMTRCSPCQILRLCSTMAPPLPSAILSASIFRW